MDTNRAGGGALVVGFLSVLLVLFREPASGVAAATGSVASLLYFVVLPLVGLLVGVYAYAGGPYSTAPMFLAGSYLGVFALALTLRGVLAVGPVSLLSVVGLGLLTLSLVAVVGSVLQSTPSGALGFPSDR